MAAIDIGAAAIDRNFHRSAGTTYVTEDNSANGTGVIDTVETWFRAGSPGSDVEVATFIDEGSNVLSTRDSELLGSVTDGSKQTFSGLDMDVRTGDWLGIYMTAGQIERTNETAGQGIWQKGGDYIPASSAGFTYISNHGWFSLYGTGTTAWIGTIMGVNNPGKIYGVDVANISKVMGVS